MSQPVYELLQRHPDLLKRALIIGNGAELANDWQQQLIDNDARILTWDWQTLNSYSQLNAEQKQLAVPQNDCFDWQPDHIIVLWPKSKPLAKGLIQFISGNADRCFAVASNNAGGKSIGNTCADVTQHSEKLDSARRCSLWQLDLIRSDSFNWLKQAQSFSWQEQAYMTLPGVFSHGKLDIGTRVLLEHLPAPAHGKLLDLGCGSGVIGLSLKHQQNALDVTLADVDAFALRSAQLNSMRLGLSADVVASDGLQQIEGRFDYIISNPPFHQGKQTNYRFAEELFRQAGKHLVTDGQLWIVANRHLPYEEWASERFATVETLAQQDGFKILCLSQVKGK